MYHTDVFSLAGYRSVMFSHPKAILSGQESLVVVRDDR
jgi:hypothetical protein